MKQVRASIIVLSACLISSTGYAQKPLRFGIEAGVNFANQSFSRWDSWTSDHKTFRLGLVIGAVAEMKLSDRWYITAETRYIEKGMTITDVAYTIDSPNPVAYGDLVHKVNYLELPILLKAKFGTGDFRPFLLAGPNIGFLLSAIIEPQLTQVLQSGVVAPPSQDFSWAYNLVDVSLNLGGGGEYRLSPTLSLLASVRYSWGVSNTFNMDPFDYPIQTRHSSEIQVLLGAMF